MATSLASAETGDTTDDAAAGLQSTFDERGALLGKQEFEDALPVGAFSGREIYERYYENRFHSAVQYQKVISTDPGGNRQTTKFWVRWKDYRDPQGNAVDGLISRTLVKFSEPFDLRSTGFLIVVKDDYSQDQWLYQPSTRRVRRVDMVQATVGGSDLTFNDLGFLNLDDATYKRLEDQQIGDTPVYVVEAIAKPHVLSTYKKTLAFIEQEHYVPLKIRYWSTANVEIREMTASPEALKEFYGVWVVTNAMMVNLLEGTSSEVFIEDLDPNAEIADELFSTFRLTLSY